MSGWSIVEGDEPPENHDAHRSVDLAAGPFRGECHWQQTEPGHQYVIRVGDKRTGAKHAQSCVLPTSKVLDVGTGSAGTWVFTVARCLLVQDPVNQRRLRRAGEI